MKKRGRADGSEPLELARKQLKDITQRVEPGQLLPPIFYVDRDARSHRPGVRFFLKKDEAIDHARLNGNLPVWSIDKTSDGGAKYFVVASYDAFWEAYANCARPAKGSPRFAPDRSWRDYEGTRPNARLSRKDADLLREKYLRQSFQILPFAYEVVLEGVPLHLYLDIEASLETNPGLEAEELVVRLLAELKGFLCAMQLGIPHSAILNPNLVVYDSSTTRKFSKHIILKMPGVLWSNNYICGAVIHSFHLHLIRRFGGPDRNPFYVKPEASAKSTAKVCLLDFAVYTKNRDFRIVGSCKRKGCNSPRTQLRWLWVQGAREQLTKELFLSGLIQNCRDDGEIQFHIHRVWDMRAADGVPFSSSLRTPQPLGPAHSSAVVPATRRFGVTTNRAASVPGAGAIVLPKAVTRRLEKLGETVARWMRGAGQFKDYFRGGKAETRKVTLRSLRDGNYAWGIETTSSYCSIRRSKTGSANHKMGGRKANFLVWITGVCKNGVYDRNKVGRVKQMCIANSCTDGHGPSKPAWTGWLGDGISEKLKQAIRGLTAAHVETEIARLQLHSVQTNALCLFSVEGE